MLELKVRVILCTCKGKISRYVLVDELKTYFDAEVEKALCEKPEKLCKDGFDFVVFVGCNIEEYRFLFMENLEKAGINPFSLEMIDVKESCRLESVKDATEKAKLLIESSIVRISKSAPINPKHVVKYTTFSSKDFFRFSHKTFYKLVPTIKKDLCKDFMGCNFCVLNCPIDAVSLKNRNVEIDRDICEGCGICVGVCPANAIKMPFYKEIDFQLQELLSSNSQLMAIMFCCKNSLDKFSHHKNILEIPLPCVGMLTPYLILKVFDLGGDAVFILHCSKYQKAMDLVYKNVKFSKRILENFCIDSERIEIVFQKNHVLKKLAALKKFKHKKRKSSGNLVEILKNLEKPKNLVLEGDDVPFGILKIDEKKCSFCRACLNSCYSNALEVVEKNEKIYLFLNHSKCCGCGKCVEVCPENALTLKKALDFRMLSRKKIIFEDELVMCENCGEKIGTKNFFEKIAKKLSKDIGYFKICHQCRLKSQIIEKF